MRKALAVSGSLAVLVMVAGAGSASAACGDNLLDACSGQTTVAFAVLPDNGSISIVVTPAAVGVSDTSLAPTSTGTDRAKTVSVPLGVTTVLDGRTASPGWSVSASTGGFSLAGGGSIAASKATFAVPSAPSAASGTLLTGALVGAGTSSISSRPSTPQAGGSPILVSNSSTINATAFVPVMTVDVTGAASGLYTGTVTQSVS